MKKTLILLLLLYATALLNAQTIVFHESFDPPGNADSVFASGSTNFTINTRLFTSGPQSDSLEVPFNGISYLTSQSFSTVGSSNVLLQFSHICKIEVSDTAKILVSVNGGATWVKLTTQYINQGNAQFSTQGYRFSANTYQTLWIPGTPAQKPQQSWWRNEIFDISVIAGNKPDVRVRFVLKDGDGDGASLNMGWYIDDIKVLGGISELFPPKLTMKTPIIQDTVFNTGSFDIYAHIKDASGIDTAYITYQLNGGANQYIPMLFVSDSTYKGTIPSYSYNNRIDYHVFAADNSASHNSVNGPNQWFYIKQGLPDVIIGSGTVTTSNYYPFYNYYENNRSQLLYKATEINRAGVISHLAFNLSYITSNAAKRHLLNFTIKIKPTYVSTLGSAYTDMSTATTVFFNPDFYQMIATGWYTFDINDYLYDGLSNLIIEVVWGDNGVYASSGDLYDVYKTDYTSGSDILVVYGFADSETPPNYDGNSKIRPNIKFTFPVTNFSNDAGVKQVLSPSVYAISSVNLPVNLYIKNYSADSLIKATVAWNLDGIPQQPFSWTGVLMHDVVSSAVNIGSVNVAPGAHTIKAWTEFPNDSLDQNHINDTSCISFWAYNSVMNGTFTIGSSGADFLSYTDALNALLHYGINGPVVFNVQSGTYNEQISFPEIPGASAINTITFQSLTGINTDVVLLFPATAIESNYVIRLNGADHLRFKNMTFHATGAIYAHVIEITNNAVDNIFDGNNITGKVAELSMTDEVLVCKNFGVSSIDSLIVFNNNNFTNGSCAIYFTGGGSPSMLANKTSITNNIFTNQYFYGVYLLYQNAPTISGNVISTNSDADPYYGIYAGYCYNDLKILKNKVYFPSDGYGIYVSACNGSPSKKGMIANNFVRSGSSFGGSGLPRGIYTYYSPYQEIYYNSVNIRASSTTGSAFYIGSGCTPIVLKNNIFANSVNGYAIYSSATSGITSNNNDLFTTGSNLGYWGANKATITEWQASSSQDANSVSINPNFVSSTDLHTSYSGLDGMATPIAGIIDDIDGEARDVSFPDIGADEFGVTQSYTCNTPNPGNALATSLSLCSGQSVTLSLQNQTPGTGVIYQWQTSANGIAYTDINGAQNNTCTLTPNNSAYYHCIVTCLNGNVSDTSNPAHVIVNSLPTANVSVINTNVCAGSINEISLALTGTGPWLLHGLTKTEIGGSIYVLPDTLVNVSTHIIYDTAIQSAYYHIESFTDNATGCTSDTANWAMVSLAPVPAANAGTDATYTGTPVQIGDPGNGPGTISWLPVAGLNNPAIGDPLASPPLTITYTITVNNNGCVRTDEVTVAFGGTGHDISGKTRYLAKANAGYPAPNLPIYNSVKYNINKVIVKLKTYPAGAELARDTSDATGVYHFTNIMDGNYMLSYDKYVADTMQSVDHVNAVDIALLKYLIGHDTLIDPSKSFTAKHKRAADVDNNATVNSIDVARITAKIGSPHDPARNFPRGNWLALDTVVAVSGADLNVTLKTVCYGDYDASSSKYKDSASTWGLAKSLPDENIINRSDESITINNYLYFEVPLRISSKMNDFSALGLELNYSGNDFKLVSAFMPKTGNKIGTVKINPTLDEIIANDNDLLVTDEDGVLRVVYATTNHFDVAANDEMITLGFRSVKKLEPGEIEFVLNGTGVIGDMYGNEIEDAYLIMPKIFVQGDNNESEFEFAGFPNPFEDRVTLTYCIPKNGTVKLNVYNAMGELVTELVNETQASGKHSVMFSQENLPQGMYTVKMEFTGIGQSKCLIIRMVH